MDKDSLRSSHSAKMFLCDNIYFLCSYLSLGKFNICCYNCYLYKERRISFSKWKKSKYVVELKNI